MNGGQSWDRAAVAPGRGRGWQSWRHTWRPAATGPAVLSCRATDAAGQTQPLDGARDAVHRVGVTVARAGRPRGWGPAAREDRACRVPPVRQLQPP